MHVRDVGAALWRQRPLVLAVLLVGAAVLWAALSLAPRTYGATAVVSVRTDPAVELGDEAGDTASLRRSLGDLATSATALSRVSNRIGGVPDVARLRREVQVEAVPGTVLVRVRVRDADPRVAARVADAVAQLLPQTDPGGVFLFRVTEPARVAGRPVTPDVPLVGGLGLVVVVLLAVGLAVVCDRRTATVGRGGEVEDAASAPLLAHLSPPRDPTALPVMEPGTAAAETFGVLGLSVDAELTRHPADRLVVAGAASDPGDPGDAVSQWVGANLAIVLADKGRRVVLVDARQEAGWPGPEGVLGALDVADGTPIDDALALGPSARLQVLPVGDGRGVVPGPRLLEVVERAQSRAELAVVLAPSLLRSDDARVLAAGAVMLLVLPEGRLTGVQLRAHADRLRATGVRLLGVVLVRRRPAPEVGQVSE